MSEEMNITQINETAQPLTDTQPGRKEAVASLVLGIVAMVLPIPVLDLIAGIIGIVLSCNAKKQGYKGGMEIAGLVCSIVGTVWAAVYTLFMLFLVPLIWFSINSMDTFL